MWDEIYAATKLLYSKAPSLKNIIETRTGIVLPVDGSNNRSVVKGVIIWIKKILKKL